MSARDQNLPADTPDTRAIAYQAIAQLEVRLGNLAVRERELEARLQARENQLHTDANGDLMRQLKKYLIGEQDPEHCRLLGQVIAIPKERAYLAVKISMVEDAGAKGNLRLLKLLMSSSLVRAQDEPDMDPAPGGALPA